MIETLRQRNFALLWTAGLLSILGDWALYAALPVFVYEETGSVFVSGALWVVIFLPNVAVGPVAGVFVDRWDRRRTMLVANAVQMLAMLPLAVASGDAAVVAAFAVALAQASVATFSSPAESALLPRVVPADRLPTANALNVMNDNIGRIVGPLVGALALSWGGLGAVALLDAATFGAAALLVGLVRLGGVEEEEGGGTNGRGGAGGGAVRAVWRELGDGVRVVRGSAVLMALFAVVALRAFADGPLTAMLAPYITGSLGGAERFGLFLSFRGVAGIVGSLLIARVAVSVAPGLLLGGCVLAVGGELVVAVWADDFWVFCALMVLVGPAIAGMTVGTTTLVQQETADAWRGRVFSLVATAWGLMTVAGTAAGSALGSLTSPRLVILVSGLLYVATGALAVATLGRRRVG